MWIRKTVQHGDTLTVSLPAWYCREYMIKRGDYVAIWLGGDHFLRIAKQDPGRRPDLMSEDPDSLPPIQYGPTGVS